jgi:hypothetical protein
MDLDELVGKEVSHAIALNDLKTGWLQQVVFQVEGQFVIFSVEADYDEIICSIAPELDLNTLGQQFSSTRISNQRKRISYIWRMTNHQGYEDAVQLEFDDVERTNVQLLAEGSQLLFTIFRRH